jgi:Zn-dependent peptidase ImmA (M78 family)/transcriptional regulator with XRE-family HTH domain
MPHENNILAFPEGFGRPLFNRERLKDARLAACLTLTELADRIDVSVETVSNLESGQRQPGPDTLLKLCKEFNCDPTYFTAPDQAGVLQSAVFFRSYASKTKRQNLCLDVWRRWSGTLLNSLKRYINLPPVCLPQANWIDLDVEDDGLTERADALATECRRTWNIGDGPIANLLRLAESMGVCVVRLRLPDMEDVDGFSCWQDDRPIIFLIAKTSAARERLNVAHELLHLIAHRQLPAETLENKETMRRIEAQAFAFAGALLLPRTTYAREIYSFKIPHFIELKRRWGVAIAAQGKRCLDLGIMEEERFTQFRKNLSWHRYIKSEPLDDSLPHEEPLMMKQAIDLLEQRELVRPPQIAQAFGFPAATVSQITNVEPERFVPTGSETGEPAVCLTLREETV